MSDRSAEVLRAWNNNGVGIVAGMAQDQITQTREAVTEYIDVVTKRMCNLFVIAVGGISNALSASSFACF